MDGFVLARIAKHVAGVAITPNDGRVGLACRDVLPGEELQVLPLAQVQNCSSFGEKHEYIPRPFCLCRHPMGHLRYDWGLQMSRQRQLDHSRQWTCPNQCSCYEYLTGRLKGRGKIGLHIETSDLGTTNSVHQRMRALREAKKGNRRAGTPLVVAGNHVDKVVRCLSDRARIVNVRGWVVDRFVVGSLERERHIPNHGTDPSQAGGFICASRHHHMHTSCTGRRVVYSLEHRSGRQGQLKDSSHFVRLGCSMQTKAK